jgi:hypothetical protein
LKDPKIGFQHQELLESIRHDFEIKVKPRAKNGIGAHAPSYSPRAKNGIGIN